MEDNKTHDESAAPQNNVSSAASSKPRYTQKNQPKPTTKKSSQRKKKPFREVWRSYSRVQQAKFIISFLAALGVVGYLLAYVTVSIIQERRNQGVVQLEHRPKVIISRPPQLLGTISCEVTDKAIFLHTGAMRVWVKNIQKGDAVGAFIAGPELQLVPEKKIGDPFFDDPPAITDETCKANASPKARMFPAHGGEETGIDIAQSAGTVSLIKTKSVSVTLGGPQKEPETPAGEKPSARVPIAKDAVFQLYAPVCVYYFDEDGARYGSCRSYRLVVSGRTGPDTYGFSCTDSPVEGTFETTLFGYCEN